MKLKLMFSLMFLFVIALLLNIKTKVIYATGSCPGTATCLPTVRWDRPAGCDYRTAVNNGTEYYIYWQAYSSEWLSCPNACGWGPEIGEICDGGAVDFLQKYQHDEIYYGGCCSGSSGNEGNTCHYVSDDGCYSDNCPDDLSGNGKGTNGCSSNEYWCTGGHMEGDCGSSCSPVDGKWTPFTTCTKACGGGTQSRTCTNPAPDCGGANCSGASSQTCNSFACGPWWQVKDGDVVTNGDLKGKILVSGNVFNLVGSGGYPGIPTYGGTTDLTKTNVSTTGWVANSTYSSSKLYNSTYFFNSIPSDVSINTIPSDHVEGSFFESGGTSSYGYYWYVYDADETGLDLYIDSSANLGSRKVILLVKGGNIHIGGNINLTDGSGFFLTVAGKNSSGGRGSIIVSPSVGGGVGANLEGIYVADALFVTNSYFTNPKTDSQLKIRGTVVGYDGISLQRDLSDNTAIPAELFEYAPDQDLLFPAKLSANPSSWREVAP